ncbi:MAG: protein-L-isoaspartate(D-aspartate) O-methyltransferase [Flavobacteriales bacterium]|nr:protein-L-isoaspartate(D-aspartate) O-methyltransferase [Flavobacteriales bacterium]
MASIAAHLQDTYRHRGMRRKMLDGLRQMGIADERVLSAMDEVPRHYYLDAAFDKFAYENKAFQIGAGQTISHPYTVARQSELLQLPEGSKVLEIGTGSGFQCAVLCAMGYKVYSIERQKELYDRAKPFLKQLGYRADIFYGDGYKGKPVFAPFDGILVTCGAPSIPEALLGQLNIGGRIIIPIDDASAGEGVQIMTEVRRVGQKKFTRQTHGHFAFVPMLASRVR